MQPSTATAFSPSGREGRARRQTLGAGLVFLCMVAYSHQRSCCFTRPHRCYNTCGLSLPCILSRSHRSCACGFYPETGAPADKSAQGPDPRQPSLAPAGGGSRLRQDRAEEGLFARTLLPSLRLGTSIFLNRALPFRNRLLYLCSGSRIGIYGFC